jgi:RNA-directed DNA polymerase
MVNGPEDATLSWEAVDWRHHEDNVRRLRQRIFTAAQEGNNAREMRQFAERRTPRGDLRVMCGE